MGRRFTKDDFDRRPNFLSVVEMTDTHKDGTVKELFAFADNHGYIYEKEKVIDILEKAIEFYNRSDTEEWIKQQNKENSINNVPYPIPYDEESGKYLMPKRSSVKKPFKTKTSWTTKCGWCQTKMTYDSHGYYYMMNEQIFDIYEHACSEACADLLWKEAIKNWINACGYKEFFDLS